MDAAFDRPRRYARNHNLRLSDVAGQVVETRYRRRDRRHPTQRRRWRPRGPGGAATLLPLPPPQTPPAPLADAISHSDW